MKISAAIIVRNEAQLLKRCLESIAGVVDDLVVVDTGSDDDTVDVARAFTPRLFTFPWVDDFAVARNFSIEQATGDYILNIDADNVLENAAEARGLLDAFAARYDETVAGTVEITSTLGVDADAGVSVESAQRFFRRGQFHYEGSIHEQLAPRIPGHPHRVAPTGLRYSHSGYAHAPASPRHKAHRNKRMLEAELAANPADDYYLFQLGRAHFSLKEFEAAADAFERALAAIRFAPGAPPLGHAGPVDEDVLSDLLVTAAYAYINSNQASRAQGLLETHRALGHAGTRRPDFPHALGYVYLMIGDVERARAAYEEALALGPGLEIVGGTGSYSSYYHLGLLSEAGQDVPGAFQRYVQAVQAKPDYHPALARCVDLIVEYGVELPAGLWSLVNHVAFTAVYTEKLRSLLRGTATEQTKALLRNAILLSPELASACSQAANEELRRAPGE